MKTELTRHTVNLFKCVVSEPTALVLDNVRHGFVTNFVPTKLQLEVLKETFKDLPIVTLFTVKERNEAPMEQLILKQILHYIEVYGLNEPGLFGLEVEEGKVESLAYIRAISIGELEKLVQDLLYSNRPIADSGPIVELIDGYDLSYDVNKIQNNELRIALFNPQTDKFTSGDDAVRYICYVATGSTMLIKSKAVIEAVKKQSLPGFLLTHVAPLAKVFNRHKRIIMACKNPTTRSTINRISHLSKKLHVPFVEPISKKIVSEFVKNKIDASVLEGVSIRDKFKYLNLIEWKLQGHDYDVFLIRNGRVWFERDRKALNPVLLRQLSTAVMNSIKNDLKHLEGKSILLDQFVDYGLPISRKQCLGNLPFGTKVKGTDLDRFSAGIYWHNDFGKGRENDFYRNSIDLDLTAIDDRGNRTGWGGYAAYNKRNPITFSGDMTDARDGAMEFMTVNPLANNRYGLMVNIFRGPEPCDCEIVVGSSTKKQWIENTMIRERISLNSKESVIGFLNGDSFIVYSGRLSNNRVARGKHPVIDKGLGALWTVQDILISCGIKFDTTPQPNIVYDYDLRYSGFSLDKLEGLLKA